MFEESTQLADPAVLLEAFYQGALPDPYETLSEWSDSHRIIPSDACDEHGLWRTSRVPFTKEIMDCLSPRSEYESVVLMKPTQIAGSETLNNLVAYVMAKRMQSMMIVQPTLTVAEEYSKLRIAPMIREMPELLKVMRADKKLFKSSSRRSRDSDDTILTKKYDGGFLKLAGANSAASLRSTPIRFLVCDEVDGYVQDCEGEGPPHLLAFKRTDNFSNRKIFLCSTPVDQETSVIEPAYLASDQRLYCVPCPFCDHGQALVWKNLMFRDLPGVSEEVPKYLCEQCKELIPEHFKTQMLEQGQWVKQKPEVTRSAGFRLNGLYTPVGWKNTWANMVREFLEAKHEKDPIQKRIKQKTFTNTRLAETWHESEAPPLEIDQLLLRREPVEEALPDKVLVITGGLDVQEDRIEFEIVGWGPGRESWSLDYQVFFGNPTALPTQDLWNQLDIYRTKKWVKKSGEVVTLSMLACDTGHHTHSVYRYIAPRQRQGVRGVKGSNEAGVPLVNTTNRPNKEGVVLHHIGTVAAKDYIFGCLHLTEPGPGYCHFSESRTRDYFKGLLSEKEKKRMSRGRLTRFYEQIVERNEPLDIRVYALAALLISGFPLDHVNPQVQVPPSQPHSAQPSGWLKGGMRPERKPGGWLRR